MMGAISVTTEANDNFAWWYNMTELDASKIPASLVSPTWQFHDDVIKWNHFPRYWPLGGEFTGHRWIPRTKASDAMFDVSFDPHE